MPTRPGRVVKQPNLTAQTASGLRWFYLSTMTLMVANLAYTATVSRLLDAGRLRAHGHGQPGRPVHPVLRPHGAGVGAGPEAGPVRGGDPGLLHRRHRHRPGLPGGGLDPGPGHRRLVPGTGSPADPACAGRVVRVHGLVHDGTGPAAPRAPLPHPVDDLGGHVRVRLPRRGRRPGPARGRRVEPGGGVGGVHGGPGGLAVRRPPASAPAGAPLGAVPGGLRLRGAPVGRLPDGLRRRQPRHLHGQPVSRAPRCSASTPGRTTWSSSRSATTWPRR